jgi:group I intron endonuclease
MSGIIHQNSDLSCIPSTPGIYAIVNVVNQQMYIGSTKDLKQRAHLHFHRLEVGNHPNIHLCRAYDLYGRDAFRFDILELIEHAKNLLAREQHYINKLKPQYNIARLASRNLGIIGRKHPSTSLCPEMQAGISKNATTQEEKEQTATDIQSDMQIWLKTDRLLDKVGLASSEKAMIASLLAFADAHGITVSYKKLAKYQGYSERQVYNIIRSLKEKGLF